VILVHFQNAVFNPDLGIWARFLGFGHNSASPKIIPGLHIPMYIAVEITTRRLRRIISFNIEA
jgi:hypothetical protein